MTVAGWILLVVSCGTVIGLSAWCFWKVLTLPPRRDGLHAPLDIETGERDDDV